MTNETGDHLKKDDGKPRMDLIPPRALLELGKVYAKGAEKYKDRGWEEGRRWGRDIRALETHLQKWKARQQLDPDTGCHHLIMAAWNCISLFTYEMNKVGEDDRTVLNSLSAEMRGQAMAATRRDFLFDWD